MNRGVDEGFSGLRPDRRQRVEKKQRNREVKGERVLSCHAIVDGVVQSNGSCQKIFSKELDAAF